MKDIDKKDLPEVSGGISPHDYIPPPPIDIGGEPVWPLPEPLPSPDGPQPFILDK